MRGNGARGKLRGAPEQVVGVCEKALAKLSLLSAAMGAAQQQYTNVYTVLILIPATLIIIVFGVLVLRSITEALFVTRARRHKAL